MKFGSPLSHDDAAKSFADSPISSGPHSGPVDEIPREHQLLEPFETAPFGKWIDAELAQLEERLRDFCTAKSIKGSLAR